MRTWALGVGCFLTASAMGRLWAAIGRWSQSRGDWYLSLSLGLIRVQTRLELLEHGGNGFFVADAANGLG